jgi:hypothetical protein
VDERRLILANRLTPAVIQEFAQIVRSFRLAWGPSTRVVSVFDSDSEALSGIPGVERWTDCFDYRTHHALWSSAYAHTDALISRVQPSSAALLRNFYHDVADTVLHCVAAQHILETANSPLVMLLQSSGRARHTRENLKVLRLNRKSLGSLLARAGIEKAREVALRGARRLRFTKPSRPSHDVPPETGTSAKIIVSIEDSGTQVNLSPALTILQEMRRRGLAVVIVSSRSPVLEKVRSMGFAACNLIIPSMNLRAWSLVMRSSGIRTEMSHLLRTSQPDTAEWLYLDEIRAKALDYVAFESNIRTILDGIRSSAGVISVLVMNESSHLAAVIMDWAKRCRVPGVGFNPILVGERPDNKYFPAPVHAVYGEQLRSLMISIGIAPETIHVVGTPSFDSAFFRDREKDRIAVSTGVLRHWKDRKLVVVGTEALPQPLVELEPVLRVLGEMPDVHVVLKVHPSDSLSFYQDFVQNLPCADNIEVVKDCEVQALLHTADLLVCIISNMIVMAAILGTPTLVCDFSGKRRPLDFVAEGLSFGCFSQSEIAPMVRRLLFDPAAAQEWRQMRRTALRGFNGPNDGQSHSRVVDLVMAVAGKMELCPTTS